MKKIYIINPFENSLTDRGRRHFLLFKELQRSTSCSCYLITSDFDHAHKKRLNLKDYLTKEIVFPFNDYNRHIGLSRFIGYTKWNFYLTKFLIKNLRPNDVVISTSISPSISLVAGLIALKKNGITIVDIRDIWPTSLAKNKRLLSLLLLHYHLFNFLAFSLAQKLVVSNKEFLNYFPLRPFKRKTTSIPLGFDNLRRKANTQKQVNWEFVYVGNFNESFDMRVFSRKTISEIQKAKTIFIGDGPLKSIYQEMFPNALFTGLISKEMVDEYLCKCKIGLLPINSIASFPNKLNDYIFHELDILSNPGSHLKNIFAYTKNPVEDKIYEFKDIIVDLTTEDQATKKIIKLIEPYL